MSEKSVIPTNLASQFIMQECILYMVTGMQTDIPTSKQTVIH